MAIHVGEQTLQSHRAGAVPLEGFAGALGWELKPLDDVRFSLCPEPDRCVPIPEDAVEDGELRLDHDGAAAALGLISVHDRQHTVVELASAATSGLVPAPWSSSTCPTSPPESPVRWPKVDGPRRSMHGPHGECAATCCPCGSSSTWRAATTCRSPASQSTSRVRLSPVHGRPKEASRSRRSSTRPTSWHARSG